MRREQEKAMFAKRNQTKRGMRVDRTRTAKNTRPLTKDNVARWKKHPNRSDIQGVDTMIIVISEKKPEMNEKTGIHPNEDQLINKDIEKHRGKEIRPRKGVKPSIDWQSIERGKLKANEEHTIAKGSVKDFESTEGYYNECTKKSTIRIKIKDEDISDPHGPDEEINVRVGGNIYSKGYLYDIAEDASGEKILTKTGDIRKSAIGKVVVLNVRTKPNPDRFDPTYPMIVEGKDSMYAIAPKLESD